MRLPKRTLVLWNAHLVTAEFLLIPVAHWLYDIDIREHLIIAAINLLLCVSLFLRYINITLHITPLIVINSGVLIKKQTTIKPHYIYGIKQIRTPLSSALNLSAMVIYCEGKRYVLPPTDNNTCKGITDLIKKANRGAKK